MKSIFIFFIFLTNAFAQLTIDDSCFKDEMLSETSKEQMYKNLRHNLNEARSEIFWCEYKYPQIRQYTREWRYIANNLTISCEEESEEFGAYFLFTPEPLIKRWKGRVTLHNQNEKNILTQKLQKGDDGLSSIMHEIFHGTSANNISAHNHLSRDTKDCNDTDNFLSDRVYYLEALCSGRETFMNAKFDLYKQIQKCGINFCTDLFTSSRTVFTQIWQRSGGLDQAPAQQICKNIYYQAACNQINISTPVPEDFLNSLPIKNLRANLKRDVQSLPTPKKIPLSYVNATPDLKAGYTNLRNSICFEERFKIVNNSIQCNDSARTIANCHFDSAEGNCSEITLNNVKNLVNELALDINYAGIDEFVEGKNLISYEDLNEFLNDRKVRKALGTPKIVQYKDTIKKFHPWSMKRNCETFKEDELASIVNAYYNVPKEVKIDTPKCE